MYLLKLDDSSPMFSEESHPSVYMAEVLNILFFSFLQFQALGVTIHRLVKSCQVHLSADFSGYIVAQPFIELVSLGSVLFLAYG
jgi:hypothetical protein